MTLSAIALVLAVGLIGPALASWQRGHIPVAVGEILVGVLFGPGGLHAIPVGDPTLTLLESIGFALVMLVVGSHLNVRAFGDRVIARHALRIVLLNLGAAVVIAFVIQAITGYANVPLFALLLTSSSAAIVLPVLDAIDGTRDTRVLIASVTIADVSSIVGLPLIMRSGNPGQTTIVALAIAGIACVGFRALRAAHRRGTLERFRDFSTQHRFGLELRISLLVVIGLAAFASHYHVTVMIAGFAVGIVIAAVGAPQRLAGQLFAVTEGFFSPVFFVMLGTSLDVRHMLTDARGMALAVALSVGTVLVHLTSRVLGLPVPQALMSGAQLGVPVAAVTIGAAAGTLTAVESSAILTAALVSILITALAARSLEGTAS